MKYSIIFLIIFFTGFCFSQQAEIVKTIAAGACYTTVLKIGDLDYKQVDCKLTTNQNLEITSFIFNPLSKKDEKVIKKKLLKHLKKGLTIQVSSHFASAASSKINHEKATINAKQLVTYLMEKGIDANKVLVVVLGDSNPVDTCITNNCEEFYKLNSRFEFKIINNIEALEKAGWYYNEEFQYWSKSKS